jgi:CheY-like chemotaxis protein
MLVRDKIPGDDPLQEQLGMIQHASERAAALTRQLLAFSRKQMLAPTRLDLNQLVHNLRHMLERLIGEDISLSTVLQPELWPITADPGQLEQVIVNLAVNARDAMPTGGRLTIETGNIYLDGNHTTARLDIPPGPYVLLAITDTGCGMDEQIQAHLFEPFFTTKEVGKGTGLGLAMVYGIIKQSGGDITVYSQPEQGTTLTIYIPAHPASVPRPAAPSAQPISHGGSEVILLVEDEEMVRDLMCDTLQNKGYTVLEASQGQTALSLAKLYEGQIDLLLTDVVMPQMSGRELAERLKALQPGLKILFMSGYTDDTVVRHGLLAAKVDFLPKPFLPSTLALKVREILDK